MRPPLCIRGTLRKCANIGIFFEFHVSLCIFLRVCVYVCAYIFIYMCVCVCAGVCACALVCVVVFSVWCDVRVCSRREPVVRERYAKARAFSKLRPDVKSAAHTQNWYLHTGRSACSYRHELLDIGSSICN